MRHFEDLALCIKLCVAIAQFSDDARTEFKLNSYGDKERLLDANQQDLLQGREHQDRARHPTREGQHLHDRGGVRRGIPNVLVVLTDGRSQDDVNKVSKEMQMEGYIVFAIGFADADYGELVSIASKPIDRHVFFVDDLDAFAKIEEKLVTFVCEAATATCPSVPMSGSITPGFRMMELFGLVENRYSSVPGVSMVPGTFNTFPSFHLHSDAFLAQPTRFIHPEGLPSDYTITLLFRLLPNTPEEPFALWEILNKNNEPLVGVIMDMPIPTPAPTTPPSTTPLPTIPPAKEVCKAAKADLVFLVDGSWSIGDENFLKIIRFLYSTTGALDRIGPDGTQVRAHCDKEP
ncbi:collagen alpha-1(XIV) chain-like [Pseudochaenichthys georgianus]|uniref:collagen alpha-1(XIV) chain-like n=1 Tax=Pseudochaenichthys georgianus TaxID=52239 RepID=UPI0039C29802